MKKNVAEDGAEKEGAGLGEKKFGAVGVA